MKRGARAFDSDDEEPWTKRSIRSSAPSYPMQHGSGAAPVSTTHAEDDEIDPLDAFMAGIVQEAAKPSSTPNVLTRRDDLEEEDNIESYISHMKKQGVDVGSLTEPRISHDYNSDEEVYATARAIDAAAVATMGRSGAMVGAEDETIGGKRDIEPLPPVDHSKIEYIEIAKDLYEEHAAITNLSDSDVNQIRRQFDMNVTGQSVPKPCISFAHFGFEDCLLSVIARQDFSEPTGIQRQAIPAALSGRDIIVSSSILKWSINISF